jgi:hypothetical protein
MDLSAHIIENIIGVFKNYKSMGEKSFEQLSKDADFHFKIDGESNSIAIIIQHMSGNMISRWTEFLTADGEKDYRNRDGEFEDSKKSRQELIKIWEDGWNVLFNTLNILSENDLLKMITIRNESLTVFQALNRQVAHYSYHVGQIVFIAKHIRASEWKSLSIPKNASSEHKQGNYLNNLK